MVSVTASTSICLSTESPVFRESSAFLASSANDSDNYFIMLTSADTWAPIRILSMFWWSSPKSSSKPARRSYKLDGCLLASSSFEVYLFKSESTLYKSLAFFSFSSSLVIMTVLRYAASVDELVDIALHALADFADWAILNTLYIMSRTKLWSLGWKIEKASALSWRMKGFPRFSENVLRSTPSPSEITTAASFPLLE